MKIVFKLTLLVVASAVFIAGCDQARMGGAAGASNVAVIDLAAIAKATNQDEAIRVQVEAARNELTAQLQQLAANLDSQLQAEREKLGEPLSDADAQRMQELSLQAQQQINNAQNQAQQQAGQFEQNVVAKFRDKIRPLAEKIANDNGASVVLAVDAYMFWFDSSVDITADVIAAWRALPEDERNISADDVAAVEAEVEEVEAVVEAPATALDEAPAEAE